jgi:capsular polysaccharide biosynthesis protein/Mrp family chromosome partitioning ATPase
VPEANSSLAQYLSVVRRQLWLVVLVAGLALGVTFAVTSQQESRYRASMKIVVGQGGGVFQPEFSNATDTFTATMSNLLKSDVVARTVISDLGLQVTPKKLLSDLKVSSRPQSSVLEVSYTSPSRSQSLTILREIGSVFTQLVRVKLGTISTPSQASPGSLQVQPISASVFDPAHAEQGRVSPRPVRNLLFAGILGLVLGIALGFIRENLDDRLRNTRDAERWFEAPVLGTVPKGLRGRQPAILSEKGGGRAAPHAFESLRLLGANLQFAQGGFAGPSILVTSAAPEEGKSTLVAHLGVSLALAGHEVICVEADLRRPRLYKYLGADPAQPGVVEVLRGAVPLEGALQTVLPGVSFNGQRPAVQRRSTSEKTVITSPDGGRLRVLPSGTIVQTPTSVLTPENVERILEQLKTMCDFVLIDAPPLLLVADAFPLVLKADTVIVVARQGRTTRQHAQTVTGTLAGLGVQHVGVVVTDAVAANGYKYAYGPQPAQR